MYTLMNWNPVYNFVFMIKHEYQKKIGQPEYKKYEVDGKEITCLEYWILALNNKDYTDRIKYLEINQNKELLLVRYAKYSDVLSGEEEITLDDIWDMYDGFYLECRSVVFDLKSEEIVIAPFKNSAT